MTPFRYLVTFFLACSIVLGGLMTLTFRGLFLEQIFTYQVLQDYQTAKLAEDRPFDTILVGDSSLGNGVDAEYLGALTGTEPANLALTGMYGFAGAYNMVKRAVRSHPVESVIVMVTLSTWQKPVSYDGYLYTVSRAYDLIELSTAEKWQVLKAFINSTLAPKTIRDVILYKLGRSEPGLSIDNDYIRQATRSFQFAESEAVTGTVTPNKTRFLEKLASFCDARGIRLIYVHGPYLKSLESASQAFIGNVNDMLEAGNIRHTSMPISIDAEHIGDSMEHVHPDFKRLYTERLATLIGPRLD
jgi:hypothetical protein